MKKKIAPIILFVYNRYDTLTRVVKSVQKNKLSKKSELHIFSDGAKNTFDEIKVLNIRTYIKKIKGFKKISIYESKKNIGLSNSIIGGVTKILKKYKKAIIIEDDILVSKYFLEYMNKGLSIYKNKKNVASIHGYQYPLSFPKNFPDTFFVRGADCWGWATWERAWKFFEKNPLKLYLKIKKDKQLIKEFNYGHSYNFLKMLDNQVKGKINSWAIRWYAATFLKNMYTLYPKKSYVMNIGFDNDGTHSNNFFHYNSKLINKSKNLQEEQVIDNPYYRKNIEYFYKKQKFYRWINFVKYKISSQF
jgi:hypothetical protein